MHTYVIKVQIFWEGYKFDKIPNLVLTLLSDVKTKMEISLTFVAVSEYLNFTIEGVIEELSNFFVDLELRF